jgi:hypothetical protein
LPEDPELLPENERSWIIWQIVQHQVRIGSKGVFALDLGAVVPVIEHMSYDEDFEMELLKMQELFAEKYLQE